MGKILDRALERLTGVDIEQMRSMTVAERRVKIETEKQEATQFYSAFPLIGRGNVMREHFLSHTDVNRLFDNAVCKQYVKHKA